MSFVRGIQRYIPHKRTLIGKICGSWRHFTSFSKRTIEASLSFPDAVKDAPMYVQLYINKFIFLLNCTRGHFEGHWLLPLYHGLFNVIALSYELYDKRWTIHRITYCVFRAYHQYDKTSRYWDIYLVQILFILVDDFPWRHRIICYLYSSCLHHCIALEWGYNRVSILSIWYNLYLKRCKFEFSKSFHVYCKNLKRTETIRSETNRNTATDQRWLGHFSPLFHAFQAR